MPAAPADPEGRAALAELCAAYWYPIFAYIRRHGHDADDAYDLTQAFFARLLEKGTVAAADPARGRFRAFLLADCRFFLADARDRENALKRGGGAMTFSLDARDAETPLSPRARSPGHARPALRPRLGDWPSSTRPWTPWRGITPAPAGPRCSTGSAPPSRAPRTPASQAEIGRALGHDAGRRPGRAAPPPRPLRSNAPRAGRRDPGRAHPGRRR